ncbi:hypothetical protein DV515_00011226 [Chloebia gouldiae]|uniref:Uncharacterized protein n=1 Tax=Chloebia gouldiae TaxID=44316 RepID=A0A3L8S838_CHLGU|nr:hypothetical protein DV515_00011226 [Chloebia gouldiae]
MVRETEISCDRVQHTTVARHSVEQGSASDDEPVSCEMRLGYPLSTPGISDSSSRSGTGMSWDRFSAGMAGLERSPRR